MEKSSVMTSVWSKSGLVFERTAFGTRKDFKSFNELIFNMHHPVDNIYNTLEKACLKSSVVNDSDRILSLENASLLDPSFSTAIEIVRRHLKEINSGSKDFSFWCYLDEAKRACVHFINKKGWYAELFILSELEASVIHIIDDNDEKLFIPVIFSKDISNEFKKVSIAGGRSLQHYTPRVSDGILRRRSRGSNGETKENQAAAYPSGLAKRTKDMGDNL
jgi:hypothetical protein